MIIRAVYQNCQKQAPEVFFKKDILKHFAKFTGKPLTNFIKTETLAQVFCYEFCEISKKTFSYRTPLGDYCFLDDNL